MNEREVLKELENHSDPKAALAMARFGIIFKKNYGVPIPILRDLAKKIKKDHPLALKLWKYNIRETRILASMIDDPKKVTENQAEKIVKEFDNWEICDQWCMNLFEDTTFAYKKAAEWPNKNKEFIRRAGFVMMARLAVSDKNAENNKFENFFQIIIKYSNDKRNFVKKAINWALRQIGKRNKFLNKRAIEISKNLLTQESASAKWIARDALRELTSAAIQMRLK